MKTYYKKSEFGQGLTYNLGLFLAHAERYSCECYNNINRKVSWTSWFNGSSDHLYNIKIPKKFPIKLTKRILKFQKKCLGLGHGYGFMNRTATLKDFEWSIKEAKRLLLMIDDFFGIDVKEANYK